MTTSPQIRVVLIGMDERTETALRILFSKSDLVFDADIADVLVIDCDSTHFESAWEMARKGHPQARAITVSYKTGHPPSDGFLQKPFKPADLHALILRICRMSTLPYSPHIEERRRVPRLDSETHYDPEKHLQHSLQKAAAIASKNKHAVWVIGLPRSILFDGDSRMVYTELSDNALRPFCMVPLQPGSVSLQPTTTSPEHRLTHRIPTEAFLWKTAMWTARGRLPVGCDPDRPAWLKRWPNLTRLTEIPHALRLSALWNSQPISPLQMAERLNIPTQNVFDFFSACHALDLMAHAIEDTPSHRHEIKPHANRPVLSWIMDRLRTL